MSVGIVDSTVILHYFRKNPAARAWVDSQPTRLSVTTITWLEVMAGANSKAHQTDAKLILDKFQLLYLTDADQRWAMQQLERFQFSHHIGKDDCLIASVAYRLGVPLYTHNLKDMTPLLGSLAVKPYA
jgi:predicted nucleic acid-binding protein